MHHQHKHDLLTPTNEENQEGGVSTWSPARMRPARSAEPRGTTCRSVSRSYSFERRLRELLGAGGQSPDRTFVWSISQSKDYVDNSVSWNLRARFSHRPRTKRAQVSRQSWPLALPLIGSGLARNAPHSLRPVLPLLRTVVAWLPGVARAPEQCPGWLTQTAVSGG